MSFLHDVERGFGGRNQWPQGVADDTGAELIEEEYLDTLRWSTLNRAIFKRDDEFVAVEYQEPATEMQDWDDFDLGDIYEVEPVEIKTVRYNKKDS